MKALVTGAAGFIGSRLVERLLEEGHQVRALDAFTDYYAVDQKRATAAELVALGVEVEDVDLRTAELGTLVEAADVIFHLAGQPGVRGSWSEGFTIYDEHNIRATQLLLEAVRSAGAGDRKVVFASSSSIYGNVAAYPVPEGCEPRPYSPYGVTKLAAELICRLYTENFGIPSVSLRYFSVYGPRQRPDMGVHRMIEAALSGQAFPLFGDGTQEREMTFVDDVVEATYLSAVTDVDPGAVFNVAGGSSVTVQALLDLVGESVGTPVPVDRQPAQPGDVGKTAGATHRIQQALGWQPTVPLEEGIRRQVAWHRARRDG